MNIFPNGPQQTGTVSLDPEKQQATFTFPKTIPAGNATIKIHYTGILNNELRGFYLSKTARRSYAVTQFEATDARRAFPCFDEPAFKARFDISLTIDAGDTAISNSPIVNDTPGPGAGKHTIEFGITPKMSTYLVAFLVGDFQCTGGQQDGVDIRVCATPDKVAYTPFALEVAKFALHYYDDYFGIHYPAQEARPDRHSRLRGGRDGELRRHHLPRNRSAHRPQNRIAPQQDQCRHRHHPRDGPPVVRRPGHHELVG